MTTFAVGKSNTDDLAYEARVELERSAEVVTLARDGKMTQAIRLYRERSGIGMARAKTAVENLLAIANMTPAMPVGIPPSDEPWKTVDQKALLEALLKSPVEACSRLKDPVLEVGTRHQLFEAVRLAHNYHYPLVLDPDSIWLTIAQGLANHITENGERLRRRFVAHDGKKKIIIHRDSFSRGSPDNDWPGAFAEFSAAIKESIGEHNHSMIVADFSTTGPVERAASEVVLMDAMKSYFRYGVMTCCGIPTITLDGTVQDWERILDKVNQWEVAGPPPPGLGTLDAMVTPDLGLEWWTDHLKPILRQFIEAAKGNVDRDWWNNIFNQFGGSGPPTMTGWLGNFFPYLTSGGKLYRNDRIGTDRCSYSDDELPSSLSKAPFEWAIDGSNFDYEFVAGLTGVAQSLPGKPFLTKTGGKPVQDFAIRPVAGWAVRETPKGEVTRKGSIWDDPSNRYMDE